MNIDELEGRLDRLSDPVGQIGVAPADDVRRGHKALRRHRTAQVGAVAVAVAIVGTGTALLVGRDDPQPAGTASVLEPLTWDSLQPGYVNLVFPGDRPLQVELDANSVPLLHEVINDLDPHGEHVRPPGSSTESTVKAGVPVHVVPAFGWDGATDDVWFRLSASKAAARKEIPWFCADGGCQEKTVAGQRVTISDDAAPIWGFRQEDGEYVMFEPGFLPDAISPARFVEALADLDLPDQDLTPQKPLTSAESRALKITRDHLEVDGAALRGLEVDDGELVGRLVRGDVSTTVGVGFVARRSISSEDDSSCNPEDYTTCGDRTVGGHKVHLMWEYAAEGANVVVQFNGTKQRVWVRVPYSGRPGTGAPVIKMEALAGLLTDHRWQR
ncbi:hypothetical protein [Nocardioides sp. Root140]|uniref:hypothetical protein n=1 Tax=Nocardioides sp. Root140 TaxID=1736460 RepID=UPI0006F7AED5|nr:hypothetical protein [Nocardioides sp. Root140]KQY55543.1 hypothetical protein ASD30_16760 [Nocardioides sp. Root140]